MAADGHLNFDTKLDESGFSSGIKKLGNVAKGGIAVVGTAVAAGVAAFGALTKSALDSVASLEQNIGGVETLFKDSADAVIANAKRAYQTAGLSANDYMSTVTSFSASLLQSLAGDTEEAAKYADRAIVDMSDNANKMGTSMDLIQNAYQGFAKQNYTMLDNLKLGYGGTKTEMQRLIKDASQLKDVQAELGVTVDESSMSFGNIVNAISVMQKSMGIAGTTAKEAATTIEGSMNSAKAAWDNFLSGAGTAEEFADAFGVASEVIIKNLGEIVPRLAETVPEVAKSIYEQLVASLNDSSSILIQSGTQIVESLRDGIIQTGSSLYDSGVKILGNIINGMIESAPAITESAGEIISSLIQGIQGNAPNLYETTGEVIAAFATGIGEQLPTLIPQAAQMVATLADCVLSNLPMVISAGEDILTGLIQGIINTSPMLAEEGPKLINDLLGRITSKLPEVLQKGADILVSLINGLLANLPGLISTAIDIVNNFISGIMQNLPAILETGVDMVLQLVDGIISNLPQIIASAVKALWSFRETFYSNLPKILEAGIELIAKLMVGIRQAIPKLLAQIPGIISQIKDKFLSINWGEIGLNIIKGIGNGLAGAAGYIADAARNAAKKALNAAKSFLGIHSPSTVFRDVIGKNMALGMGVGFEDNVPLGDMESSIDNVINRVQNRVTSAESNAPLTTSTAIIRSSGIAGTDSDGAGTIKKYIIHTHVDLNGKEVGNSVTEFVDQNLSDIEELRDRGC